MRMPSSALPTALLLAATAAPSAFSAASRGELEVRAAAPELQLAPLADELVVELRCDRCWDDQRPSVGVLWRGASGSQLRGRLETLDWAEGRFEWTLGEAPPVELSGRVPDQGSGWDVALPLAAHGRPFRVVGRLEGHLPDRGTWWPAREPETPVRFSFRPLADVLEQHPQWDPAASEECDLLVAKEAGAPLVFTVGGEPRAWLHAPAEKDDADAAPSHGRQPWRFSFVRPGGTLLDRIALPLVPSDEGSAWGFHLPLAAVLNEAAAARERSGAGASPQAVDRLVVRVPELGVVGLDGCPRVIVEERRADELAAPSPAPAEPR